MVYSHILTMKMILEVTVSSKAIKLPIVLLFLLALTIPSSAQSAPSEAAIPPFPGAPLCPTHNDTQWHSLWDASRGCHYDHTHNDDPASADFLFGPAGEGWGQSISYPFMTANENNMMGHTGYKYYVNLNPQPACATEAFEYLGAVNCVSAFRIEYHDVGGNAHMVKRFHSYFMEVQVKKGNIVGTIETGGWADFGCLHGEYKKFFVTLPGVDPTNSNGQSVCQSGVPGAQDINADPYRAVGYSPAEVISRSQQGRDNPWGWTSDPRYGYNKLGFFFFRTLDSAGVLDPANPYAERFICPDFACKYNNSEHHVYSVHVVIPSSLDTDGDGVVNYVGYTDRKGNVVQGCTAPGLDCVPLRIMNAPVGRAVWARNLSGTRPAGEPVRDHDIYFNGQPSGWIQFTGQMYTPPAVTPISSSMPMPSSTPASTGTPSSSSPFVSAVANPTNLSVGGSVPVDVHLNNVPAEGYKSAEFVCAYDTAMIEKSNILASNLFGADAVVAIHDAHPGTFIVAIAGTNSNKAMSSGTAFTFSAKGLQAGQSLIHCTARVSKGDHIALDLPSTGVTLTVLGIEPSPTPLELPSSTPTGFPEPTATNMPTESPTPMPPIDGSLTGQVLASKPVTVTLYDSNGVIIQSVVANPDGTFTLTAPAGTYTVVAVAGGFLGHQGSVTLTNGNTTVRPPVSLLAGDIDANNVIDQFDALTIGMSYTTAAPSAADLNNDGIIDFLDLELLAENYRQTGPSIWE